MVKVAIDADIYQKLEKLIDRHRKRKQEEVNGS
jgi:hypothetical protein